MYIALATIATRVERSTTNHFSKGTATERIHSSSVGLTFLSKKERTNEEFHPQSIDHDFLITMEGEDVDLTATTTTRRTMVLLLIVQYIFCLCLVFFF